MARYNLKQVDSYGVERNGSFDGLVGRLQRREIELGIASVFMRADRWRVMHYCAETLELRYSVMRYCGIAVGVWSTTITGL